MMTKKTLATLCAWAAGLLATLSAQTSTNLLDGAIPASWTSKPSPTEAGWTGAKGGAATALPSNARFESSPASYTLQKDGATFDGNFMFIRWDGYSGYYVYPVELEANTTYTFAMDCAYWNNMGNTGGSVTASVNTGALADGTQLAARSFSTREKTVLYGGEMKVTTAQGGTHYLCLTSASALYAIANLSLTKDDEQPTQVLAGDRTIADGGSVFVGGLKDGCVRVEGKTDLHVLGELGEGTPLDNATIDLGGGSAWLFFDYVKPSLVIASLLDRVTVNGAKARNKTNVRVAIYANGAVVIPFGESAKQACLTVWDGENFTGNSRTFGINTFYRDLGEWDNKVRSFRLRRGFQAVLANNANGTGMSRCWTASDGDVEVAAMPEGMEGFVSFVRCAKFEWVSKKGWAGGIDAPNLQNVTCFYDWNCGGNTQHPDYEYSPIHQKAGWPSWDALYGVNDVTVLLNYNEPDDRGQANLTPDYAISTWPEALKSGLRLASPASKDPIGSGWSRKFFATLDSLNYRCDIVAAHLYRQSMAGVNMRNSVTRTSSDAGGRPVWITEFNNGANWTNEGWPTASGTRVDPDGIPMLDADGNEQTVNRPLSPENAEKQRLWMDDIMNALDECDKCERYFVYNWVQDARSMILNGKLTPAGKVYAAHRTALAFSDRSEYVHRWRIAPPWVAASVAKDSRSVVLSWYDHNGETGKKYVVERKGDDGTFAAIAEAALGTDYAAGATVRLSIPLEGAASPTFRVRALSYKDTWSVYSREIGVGVDASLLPSTLSATKVTAQSVALAWNKSEAATSYKLERSTQPTTGFAVVRDGITETAFVAGNLKPETTYYFRLTNNIADSSTQPVSDVLEVTTKALAAPEAVAALTATPGDGQIRVEWAAVDDARYRVFRATGADGDFEVVKEKTSLLRYTDTDVEAGHTYRYYIVATNDAGESSPSAVVEASLPSPTAIAAPEADRAGTGAVHDLTGRRVERVVRPGLYIVGGKKVLVR